MEKVIEDRWTQALADLAGTAEARESLAMATEAFLAMNPNKPMDAATRVNSSLSVLLRRGLGPWARSWLLETLRKDTAKNVIPFLNNVESLYQSHISDGQEGTEWVVPAFYNAIDGIHRRYTASRRLAQLFDEQMQANAMTVGVGVSSLEVSSRFLMDFSAELAIGLPPSFDQVAHLYLETIFQDFEAAHPALMSESISSSGGNNGITSQRPRTKQTPTKVMDLLEDDDTDDELVEKMFYEGHSAAGAASLAEEDSIQSYLDLCHKMRAIGFGARMTDVVTRVLYNRVEARIFTTYKRRWDIATLDHGKEWVTSIILPFLRLTLLPKKDRADLKTKKNYKMWSTRLLFYFHKTFGDLRIKEFFDIVVECPDSEPAVLDLKECIEWTGQHQQLQKAFLIAIERRLLHPGAETTDIVEFYISTIKYLRALDPTGVMLDRVSGAINKYLRTRDDTMRAIVSCILDDSNDLLASVDEGVHANPDMDDDESDGESWMPEPKNAGPDLSSARRRMADIISVLTNIYHTNDRFIEEFQTTLADRLLKATDFNIDREVRQLELLKLRFKEEELRDCEVMLADIIESKRINTNLHSLHPNIPVNAMITSRHYWPQIESETFELPEQLNQMLESYSHAFHTLKPSQQLTLFPTIGTVEIEIELEDRTLLLEVEPILAAIIHLFEDQGTWTLSALAEKLRVTEDVIEEKMEFWTNEGVVRETDPSCYELIESVTPME